MVGNYITSFIGFLPADKPEVVVYIAIDNARGVTQYGGTVAAPIAKNVLYDSANILGIEKRAEVIEKNYNYLEKKYVEVPNVTGMNANDALKLLKSFKVTFTGNGNIIKYQSIKAKERVYEGETIKLLLTNN